MPHALMAAMHIARKRFGQNFLRDPDFVQACLDAIRPLANENLIEIGPGLGALTRPLLQRIPHLQVIEIDRDLIARLRLEFAPEQLTIHGNDALKFDFGSLGDALRIVGNLPYNISTPLLFHLADYVPHISDMHFMLQKEVVARMAATPSSAAYGRLSVMLQYLFEVEALFDVPPEAFHPAPKVTSSFVRLAPHHPLPHCAQEPVIFAKIVTAAFSARRKTLRNTLKLYLNEADYTTLALDPQLRAENLDVATYVSIANYVRTQREHA